jgi:plasmid segregation protein ParM
MGGGSILLEDYIRKTGKVKKPIFIDDVHANAIGYQKLYEKRTANRQLHSA